MNQNDTLPPKELHTTAALSEPHPPQRGASPPRTIEAVIDQFLETKHWQTARTYRPYLDGFFRQLQIRTLQDIGRIPYDQLGTQISRFVLAACKYKEGDFKKEYPINKNSLNKIRSAISSFFGFLVDQFGYPKNPVTKYSVPTFKLAKKSTTESLTEDEAIRVLRHFQQDCWKNYAGARNYLAFLLLFSYGMRRSEVVTIRTDDLHYDTEHRPYFKITQKGGTEKELPLGKNLISFLLEYQQRFAHPCPYMIRPVKNNRTGKLDQPMSGNALYNLVTQEIGRLIPGKNITPHSFRTTYVRLGLEAGEDMSSLQQITGHTNTNMIGYYDTRELHENESVKRTDRMIGELTKKV